MTANKSKNIAPAITLIFLSPLITEVLPGATRFSSLFVFPIEVLVWGGGALLIRYAVRKCQLGWTGMLLLAIALSVAEEFLIQQTSTAPLVIQLKGTTYARAADINYVYLVWALIYESVSAVILPVFLTELIFPNRKNDLWINKGGVALFSILFLLGCFGAWFTWTQIARVKVFHLTAFTPSFIIIAIAVLVILFLIIMAFQKAFGRIVLSKQLIPPVPGMLMVIGGIWSILLFGLVLLAFGIQPSFPPIAAVLGGFVLATSAIYSLPRWGNSKYWERKQTFSIIFGVMIGSMIITFLGFVGASPKDLYFKIIVDTFAILLMIGLGLRIWKQPSSAINIGNPATNKIHDDA